LDTRRRIAIKSAQCALSQYQQISQIAASIRGIEAKQVIRTADASSPDLKLVALLANAHRWVDKLAQGRAASVGDLARQSNRDPSEVSRALPLAFLAPTIVKAILEGRQPFDITPQQLKRGVLSILWADQRRSFGFPKIQPA
jgi:site-specific DNA recombinase